MAHFPLFRRRQVWVPTVWGWLVLLLAASAVLLASARLVHPFLAPEDTVPGARVLVVEGWLDAQGFDQAIAIFRRGGYEQVVTTGGPISGWPELLGATNFADFAAAYLKGHGLAGVPVTAVPAPASAQDRTFLSAVKVREWAEGQAARVQAIDLVSEGTHARRSRMLYRMALGPDVAVGVLSARSDEYDPSRWWQTSAGAKAVLGELIGVVWTACCFRPPAPGSREETWGRAALR